MAEFTYNAVQEVQPGQGAIFNGSINCPKGYVIHSDESELVILRGIVNNPQACFARYQCIFNGNIAVPTGGTPGEISVSLAISGAPIQTSKAISTPTVVDSYANVTSTKFIDVPKGCCFYLTLQNTSGVPINIQNANLVVTRVA